VADPGPAKRFRPGGKNRKREKSGVSGVLGKTGDGALFSWDVQKEEKGEDL